MLNIAQTKATISRFLHNIKYKRMINKNPEAYSIHELVKIKRKRFKL